MGYEEEGYDPEELDRTMVRIPAGRFVFGLSDEQKRDFAEEEGVHPDMLYFHSAFRELETPEFWIDKFPVTRGQFLRFMKETGYEIEYSGWLVGWSELVDWHDFHPSKHDLPMVGVNSLDAQAYARWLGKRLPTEVEWEKAWRGFTGTLFPWGNSWEEGLIYRNHGNTPLSVQVPVGAYPEFSPFGLRGYGLVMEWVRNDFPATSKDGTRQDKSPFVCAGGSFFHTRTYSFLPTNRLSWSHQMRIYNAGFRCVSDSPPKELLTEPGYSVKSFSPPQPLSIRRELYLKEKIRFVPTEWATLRIFVPWFPESMWVLDCPETEWDGFGGANTWPAGPEQAWRVPWKVSNDSTSVRYFRKKDQKSIFFEAWVEGDTVRYRFEVENISPVRASSFCLKTFSPFFSSQERWTQVKLDRGQPIRCALLPLPPDNPTSFGWTLGRVSQAGILSYDGTAVVLFPEGDYTAGGNGWPHCTHLAPPENCTSYESSIKFSIEE